MSLAFNDSGDAQYYDAGSKSWKPAPSVTNDKGEKLYHDGKSWVSKPDIGMPTDVRQLNPTGPAKLKALAAQAMPGIRAGVDIASGMPAESSMTGKNMPSLQQGPDPLALASRHPYAVAAATGAAMGPTMGLGETVASSPTLTAGAGAAEQMGYQGATDLATKKLGPTAGMAVGIGLPMISPLTTALGGGRMAVKAATEAEMQRAAQEQAQNMAEEKLAMTGPQAAELAKPQINPKPGEPPSPQFAQQAQQLQQAKQTMWQQRRDALHTVGRQYDPIFQKVDEMPLTPEHTANISEGIDKARATMAARGRSFSPQTEKLLGEIAPEGVKASDASTQKLMDKLREQNPGVNPTTKKGVPILSPDAQPQTIGQLRGQLSRLRQAADSPGISAVERSGIFDATKPIIQTLDSVIPDEQKPILASINAQYAQVNKILPFKGMKAMNSAGTLPEFGEAVFGKGNQAATSIALDGMNPAQKGLMRQAWASWALDPKRTPKEVFNLLSSQKDNLAKLGFPPELSSIGSWNDLVTGANKMKTIPGLPAQKEFVAGVRDELKKSGYSQQALDAADEALRKPPSGDAGFLRRRAKLYLPMAGLMGYGVLARQPELWVPIGAYMLGDSAKNWIVNNPTMLPFYRNAVMGGWTRQGGSALGKMFVAQTRDAIQAAAAPTVRPDKEREKEAMNP